MKRQWHPISFILAIAALLLAATPWARAADPTPAAPRIKTISLGIISQRSQEEIEKRFQDCVSYLARKLSSGSDSIRGKVVVASTPLQLAKLLEEKKIDFYMDSSYLTYLINKEGAAKLLLRRWKGGMAEYRSIIFAKKDAGTARLEDLGGKIMAFEDSGSTSGYFLPRVFLVKKGFKLTEKSGPEAKVAAKEIGYIFTHSVNKIVDLVLSKTVAAGAFSNDDYGRLGLQGRRDVTTLAETELFPRHLLSIRKDLDPTLANRLKEILLSMHQDEEGQKILQRTENTTKFDILPGGEEAVRRKLMEVFRPT